MSSDYLRPGSTLGIYGGGQLGRMLAMAARRMDYRTVTLDPDANGPAAQVSDYHIAAAYDDVAAVEELARRADVITYEFENVDASALESVSDRIEITPNVTVLQVTQDRTMEKSLFYDSEVPIAKFGIAHNLEEAKRATESVGLPAIMKTALMGYDGKGQRLMREMDHVANAYEDLSEGSRDSSALDPDGDPITPAGTVVVEERVELDAEMSVICARSRDGEIVAFPTFKNSHVRGILDATSALPGREEAHDYLHNLAKHITEMLGVVGLLTVEMFITTEGQVLVNELAPRPHNSGHLTIEACRTSQFEQLVRMMAGLPHGDTSLYAPAAMANLLGDIWVDAGQNGPNWDTLAAFPGANLHLYGKSEPRRGRKMGHITAMHEDAERAIHTVLAGRLALSGSDD